MKILHQLELKEGKKWRAEERLFGLEKLEVKVCFWLVSGCGDLLGRGMVRSGSNARLVKSPLCFSPKAKSDYLLTECFCTQLGVMIMRFLQSFALLTD